ncbi:MAG: UDP-N-acetylmuramate dehydrogenase [Ignavibacteriales bacterium]|nr:UDP-N-acetylmuramate dehydrogenase [Ignavibacteriales bacterium]
MVSLNDINKFFRGHIALNEPLAKYTSMRVGGPADYYVEPADKNDVVAILKYFLENNFPYLMLGRGSNLLVSDEGYRGAAINLETGLSSVRMEGDLVVAEAGAMIPKFVDFAVQHGLAGVEMLAGIPGTVGGAVVMNAGAHEGEFADHLMDVEVLRRNEVQRIKKEDAQFAYRRSGFAGDIVLSASFRLPPGNKEELMKRRRELIIKRNESQPLELPNSGSMFKNPPNSFAARLIEQAGLKGKRIGNAQISEKHANFIVNLGGAKALDVMQLLDLAQRTVYQNTGIMLELEVKRIGFPQDVAEKTS